MGCAVEELFGWHDLEEKSSKVDGVGLDGVAEGGLILAYLVKYLGSFVAVEEIVVVQQLACTASHFSRRMKEYQKLCH